MAQGRSTKIITMIKWIRTSRLSIKNSLSNVNHARGLNTSTFDVFKGKSPKVTCARFYADKVSVADDPPQNNYFAEM